MICNTCGKEIRDDAAFCPHCGAVSGSGAPAPSYTAPEAPVSGGKKKTGLIVGTAVAVVAVIAILVVAVSGLFSSPKGQLEKAMGKTFDAYEAAGEAMGMPDLYQLTEDRSVRQRFALQLNSINSLLLGTDASALNGLGLRMNTGLDGKARLLDVELGAFWNEDDLLSLRVTADDNILYFASPQFTDGTAYGVNTETLGADMKALGADDVEDVSFNIFDLVDIAAPEGQTQEMKQAVEAANRALWEAAQVEKASGETLDVNGTQTKASAYRVTLSQEALMDYAQALKDALSVVDYVQLYREMMLATGMPQDQVEDFLSQLYGLEDPYGPLFEVLGYALEDLGDVELTVYVSDSMVCGARYENTIRGSEVTCTLALGGGARYVDDLSLELEMDGVKASVKSTGDHGGKSGAFTDKTTIRYDVVRMSSEFSWEPKSGALQWELGVDSAGTLEMAGTLTAGEDSVDLQLDNVSLRVMGMEICALGLDYYMGPCEGIELPETAPKLIGEMDGVELMALMIQVQTNAQSWVNNMETLFAQRLPAELYSLFS